MKFYIDTNGIIHGVYRDALAYSVDDIGPMEVDRASTVEYNQKTKQWEARLISTGEVISTAKSRDIAVEMEIRELEKKIKEKICI